MEEQKNTYENVTLEPDVGFDIRFVTMDHNSPFHWHREMEILYILNGHATVHMEGEEYELNPLDAAVMAAIIPAAPPPITMTSKLFFSFIFMIPHIVFIRVIVNL